MRWAATWDEVTDSKRAQRSRQCASREEATELQRKMRAGVRDKSLPSGLRMRGGIVTVAGFFPRFMELTARDRSSGSHGKVRSQFTRMIAPHLGPWDIADLQKEPGVIRNWQYLLMSGKDSSGNDSRAYAVGTVEEAFFLLSRIFDYAADESVDGTATRVDRNPCKRPQSRLAKVDRKRDERPASFTAPKVAAAYLAPMPERAIRGSMPAWARYRAAVLLAATTGGMRLGEVMSLAPEDIDWKARTITMGISLARDYYGANHFRDGKSDNSQRVMTACPLALAALAEHMETFRPITVTLPLETGAVYGRPMNEWPVIARTLIFSTGAGGLVTDPAYQSAARWGLCAAGLLPRQEITSRATRGDGGRYVPAGGSQRPNRVCQRYEAPSDHGLHFHALRHFFSSVMEDSREFPDTIIQAEMGHEQRSSVRKGALPDGVTAGYMHPLEDRRDYWRDRLREIMTESFGPLLPGLADDSKPRRLRLA